MDNIQTFAINRGLREDVQKYLNDYLKEKVIERAFMGYDVKDLAEAHRVIDEAFAKIIAEYIQTPETKVINEME
jgi:hypothetical protein